jgi:hypothetical protein
MEGFLKWRGRNTGARGFKFKVDKCLWVVDALGLAVGDNQAMISAGSLF